MIKTFLSILSSTYRFPKFFVFSSLVNSYLLFSFRFKDGKVSYGTDSPARGRRVIFCVHGNPSTGCCAVIETTADGDDNNRSHDSITEAERKQLYCSENGNRSYL